MATETAESKGTGQERDGKLARLRALGKEFHRAQVYFSFRYSDEQRTAMFEEMAEIATGDYLGWVSAAYADEKMLIESEVGMTDGHEYSRMLTEEKGAIELLIREDLRRERVALSRGETYRAALDEETHLRLRERVAAIGYHVRWFRHRALHGGQKKSKYAPDDPRGWNTAPIRPKAPRTRTGRRSG